MKMFAIPDTLRYSKMKIKNANLMSYLFKYAFVLEITQKFYFRFLKSLLLFLSFFNLRVQKCADNDSLIFLAFIDHHLVDKVLLISQKHAFHHSLIKMK